VTTRAIFWCGTLKERRALFSIDGLREMPGDPDDPMYDRSIQTNGFELAFRAARALGARPRDIHACVCDDLLPQEFVNARQPATREALQRVTRAMPRRTTRSSSWR
jgi:hypothetical protein